MIKDISTIQPGEADTERLLDPPELPQSEGIEATMAPEARAQLLTERIRENGSTAARAVWAIGRDLRTMKAEKLFQELGYDTFEDYAEQEFQLKRRQAYTYISVYEKIGQNEPVQSTAQLGITKLSLLTTVDAEDRAEILAEHDVAGMTTKELEKLLEDYKIQGEQLSLLEDKVEELESVTVKELKKRIAEIQNSNAILQGNITNEQEKSAKLQAQLESKHREWLQACDEKTSYAQRLFHAKDTIQSLEQQVKELEASKGKPEIVEKVVEKEVVKEVSDTHELNLARQLQKEAETKAEKAEERAEGAEKKLDKKHKDLLAAEKRAKEAQTEIQELKDKLAAEAEKHREELDKVKAEAQKPADSGDKQSFKHAYAASYKELTGLLEIISSTDDKQERQIFQAKAEKLLALVGEKLRELEGAGDE